MSKDAKRGERFNTQITEKEHGGHGEDGEHYTIGNW